MVDGEPKVTFGSSATKILLKQEGMEERIRMLEQATAPPSPLARMRQHWMGILILILWGVTQMMGERLFTTERARLEDAISAATAEHERMIRDFEDQIAASEAGCRQHAMALSHDRFFISDGLVGFDCGERLADGLHQHFVDHQEHGEGFPTRPGLRRQALACKEGFAAGANVLRDRLGR